MGSCLSCFGLLGSSQDEDESSETRRLLADDPYRSYNGLDHRRLRDPHHLPQPDPEAARREQQVLERISQTMNQQLLDVFAVLPTSKSPTSGASSTAQSSEHLHLASGKLSNRNRSKENETDSDEDESGSGSDADRLRVENQHKAAQRAQAEHQVMIDEQNLKATWKTSPFARIEKLRGVETVEFMSKEDREAARRAMG